MRTALVAIAAALTLSSCGAVCACGTVYVPPPSTGPGLGFDVSVTEKDRSVSIRVGQKLEAVLHANPGMTAWTGVRSSDPSVLVSIVDTGATAVRGVTLAGFQAVAPGKAQITASAGADCSPGLACPMFAVLLTIDVTVTS